MPLPPAPVARGARPMPLLGLIAAPLLLAAALGGFVYWQNQALVLQQALNESRTVADMVENIGRWASQYGGVHARTVGAQAKLPGNFLTRSVYAASGDDGAALRGVAAGGTEQAALQRVEAYHWKNPALIQREVADVVAAAGSRARFRLTAATVLNPSNAPNAFEQQALAQLKDGTRKEWWVDRGGELNFARTVVAQKSCLSCHTSAQAAPAFIRDNPQFNGGGGFGYVEGQPAGVISVTLPMPLGGLALVQGMNAKAWASLGVAGLALGWLGLALWRRR